MPSVVTIDSESGFCFGVVTAIRKAEEELQKSPSEPLYCLGDIVHNGQEVERLANLGLRTIDHEQFAQLHDAKVLLRAHGEPPSTYQTAAQNGITIIDASCPVVRHLQEKIRKQYETSPEAQIVIFGKRGHAEVIGLEGQTANTAIVIENKEEVEQVDCSKDIYLFSQTTKDVGEFHQLVAEIERRREEIGSAAIFTYHDTICGQVRNRSKHIQEFARQNDEVLFVGGKHSSNGKVLYHLCLDANPNTTFISSADEITEEYIKRVEGKHVGICGATSTPLWLMEACKDKLTYGAELINN